METATAATTNLTWPLRGGTVIVKIQHLLLSPFIVLAIPPQALLNQNFPVAIILALVGLAGMLMGKRVLAASASLGILGLLVWGKAATNIFKADPPDTAVLMVEFTAVLVLMEASFVILSFAEESSQLKERRDELSQALSQRLENWLRNQLTSLGKLGLVSLVLSTLLLPVAGLTSLSSNQLVFSATLALLAVVVLMFLVTHRREPEGP